LYLNEIDNYVITAAGTGMGLKDVRINAGPISLFAL
jgi:hypothetical protein